MHQKAAKYPECVLLGTLEVVIFCAGDSGFTFGAFLNIFIYICATDIYCNESVKYVMNCLY